MAACRLLALALPVAMSPRVIWHAGPMKSASSTMQKLLVQPLGREPSQLQRLLAIEHVAIPHALPGPWRAHKNHHNLARAFGDAVARQGTWEAFSSFVGEAARNRSDIVLLSSWIIERKYREPLFARLLPLLGLHGYELHVVLNYRRYYEWLLSMHMQRSKAVIGDPNSPQFCLKTRTKCRVHRRFVDVLRKGDPLYAERWVGQVLGAFRAAGVRTTLLNMHDRRNGSSFVERFVCDVIAAPRACAHLLAYPAAGSLHENQQSVSDQRIRRLDALCGAVAEGWVPPVVQRLPFTAVQASLDELFDSAPSADASLPVDCPKEREQRALLHATLDWQARLLPKWHAVDEQATRAAFESAARQRRLCSAMTMRDMHLLASCATCSGGGSGGRSQAACAQWWSCSATGARGSPDAGGASCVAATPTTFITQGPPPLAGCFWEATRRNGSLAVRTTAIGEDCSKEAKKAFFQRGVRSSAAYSSSSSSLRA